MFSITTTEYFLLNEERGGIAVGDQGWRNREAFRLCRRHFAPQDDLVGRLHRLGDPPEDEGIAAMGVDHLLVLLCSPRRINLSQGSSRLIIAAVRAIPRTAAVVCFACQRPMNFGGRLALKASTPSLKSSDWRRRL
jgi:hypothetical protein